MIQTAPSWRQWLALNWPLILAFNELRGLWTVWEFTRVGVAYSVGVPF